MKNLIFFLYIVTMRVASLRAYLSIDWFELRIPLARFAQDAKLAKVRYFSA